MRRSGEGPQRPAHARGQAAAADRRAQSPDCHRRHRRFDGGRGARAAQCRSPDRLGHRQSARRRAGDDGFRSHQPPRKRGRARVRGSRDQLFQRREQFAHSGGIQSRGRSRHSGIRRARGGQPHDARTARAGGTGHGGQGRSGCPADHDAGGPVEPVRSGGTDADRRERHRARTAGGGRRRQYRGIRNARPPDARLGRSGTAQPLWTDAFRCGDRSGKRAL